MEEGTFQLHRRFDTAISAGRWSLRVDQDLTDAEGDPADGVPPGGVERGDIHFTVRSPRFALPPDQVLSTFPPANAEGSFGNRLPQVVIKRRTLPWERRVGAVADDPDVEQDPPWLALVLIAEGEAEFVANAPTSECFTPEMVWPPGTEEPADVPVGNYLQIRQSMVRRIFPTQQDVDLLAHARTVDIDDTELLLGDDDGQMAVVVSNRLPLAGRDEDGEEVPTRYLACLVNLEHQYERLLVRSPDPVDVTTVPVVVVNTVATYAEADHVRMGTAEREPVGPLGPVVADLDGAPRPDSSRAVASRLGLADQGAPTDATGLRDWIGDETVSADDLYATMANPWTTPMVSDEVAEALDPNLRFPVLLHWSFTSRGERTFGSLMQGLSSALLGDTGPTGTGSPEAATDGRLPLEVVETGHVGLQHRTREGDTVRSWFRGPLLPHPPPRIGAATRLPLAHSADQLRMVVPDGREDVSLAAAFEIGRLLALSQPSIVASLLRWRTDRFRVGRRHNLQDLVGELFEEVAGVPLDIEVDLPFDVELRHHLINVLGGRDVGRPPERFFGAPHPVTTPGRPLELSGRPDEVLERGLGLERGTLARSPATAVDIVTGLDPAVVDFVLDDLPGPTIRGDLGAGLVDRVARLAAEVNQIDLVPTEELAGTWTEPLVADRHFRFRTGVGRDGPGLGGVLDGDVDHDAGDGAETEDDGGA